MFPIINGIMASVNSNEHTAQPANQVRNVSADGQSRIQVGNNYTEIHNYNEPNHNRCIADLLLTNPHDDKTRIEQTKGGLLKDSYKWILDLEDFRRWRDDRDSRLLWIKGDAGKGKTMLLCGIIDEVSQPRQNIANTSEGSLFGNVTATILRQLQKLWFSPTHSWPVSFFFCQGTDSRLNRAVAVLRGLIYVLLCQQPSLISHIQDKYDHAGRRLFEDTNAFYTLSQVLLSILCDDRAKGCYMIIDALDECEQELPQLLDFIVRSTYESTYVKWIVSSRNKRDIEQRLHGVASQIRLSLELNADHVVQAVSMYVDHKVANLVSLKGDKSLQDQVRDEMRRRADGTFLWVALVAQELEKVQRWKVLDVLKQMPFGLAPLYERMMGQIQQLSPEDSEICRLVVSAATVAYRPLRLCELGVLSNLPPKISNDLQSVQSVVDMCASFLTIRDDYVYLIHQSVKDFLTTEVSNVIFKCGFADTHHTMFLKSIEIMSHTLQRNMYNLSHPGASIDDVRLPEPDLLASTRYSCVYWVDHLKDAEPKAKIGERNLQDGGVIYKFLQEKYLYWLESLSLLRSMSEGVRAVQKLEALARSMEAPELANFLRDAYRFILLHKQSIEIAPLQVYASALIFSPVHSIVRALFKQEEPNWMTLKPSMETSWSACLQTLEGHNSSITSIAFSPDNQWLASGSYDETIKIWDPATGAYTATLKGHRDQISSIAFSPDNQWLASGSYDETIKIWDPATGACIATLKGHRDRILSIAFSPDNQWLASGSKDETIKIWDPTTGACTATLEGHSDWVLSIAFSPDSRRLASGSYDKTIKIWDPATGACTATLKGHRDQISSIVFSPDNQWLASGSYDGTIKIWDPATGAYTATLKGYSDRISSIAFSPDNQWLASGSDDKTIKIWDLATGACTATLKGHSDRISSIAFSPDSRRLASGSYDETIKIWDPAISACTATLKGHSDWILSIAFSPDIQWLASGSYNNKTIKIWDLATGACIATLKGHRSRISSIAFSSDSRRLASGSDDKTIKIWDLTIGACTATLKGHSDRISSIAFSPDNQWLASGSDDKTIKIWDLTIGACTATLEGHSDRISSIAFSPDNQWLASGSYDETIKIWDPTTGACTATLEGHIDQILSIAFSPDNQWLASGSYDETIKIWDPATGACTATLKGHRDQISSIVFSPDNQWLASGSYDETIKIWDPTTGACTATLEGHSDRILSIVFSPDSRRLASGSDDETIKIWDPAISAYTAIFKGHSDWITSIAFSPDIQWLASGSYDETIKIWDPTTGACTATLKGHRDRISSIVFSPDSRRLASGSYDKTIKIWDPTTGACTATLEGHSDWISSTIFSPDNQWLASGSDDKTIKIWDPATGACIATLKGHRDQISSIVFSPDSRRLASGSDDKTIKIWDPTTGACTATLEGHSDRILSIVFSSDSRRLASGSDDKTIKIWDPATGACTAMLKIWRALDPLIFNNLSAEIDPLALGLLSNNTTQLAEACLQGIRYCGYGVSSDGMWIVKGQQCMLWLPPEYRPSEVAVVGSTIAISCYSGRVLVMKFS